MTFWKSSDGTGCAPLRFVPQTAHERLYDYDADFQRDDAAKQVRDEAEAMARQWFGVGAGRGGPVKRRGAAFDEARAAGETNGARCAA